MRRWSGKFKIGYKIHYDNIIKNTIYFRNWPQRLQSINDIYT